MEIIRPKRPHESYKTHMKKGLTRELVKELMAFEGQIRGIDIKADADFILEEKGRQALEKVEKRLKELGYPIEYQRLKSMDFYPGGMKALSLLAIKEVLGFSDEDIERMGRAAVRTSLIIKIFIKYFGPASRFFFKESSRVWSKYWTTGKFIPVELDEEKKFGIVRVEGLNLHPVYCTYLKGYFTTLTRMVIGGRDVVCQQVKCPFKGDPYQEYLIRWK